MAIKRTKDMPPIEKFVVKMIFDDVINLPHDGKWYKYKRPFIFDNVNYEVTCSFSYDGIHLSYRNMIITRETQTILLDPHSLH